MITIIVNGKEDKTEPVSILKFIESKNLDKNKIVVEINKKIFKRTELEDYILKDYDIVEIIRFMGGGK